MNKKANAYQGILVLVILLCLFGGFYVVAKPFMQIYHMYSDNTKCGAVLNEGDCKVSGCMWENSACVVMTSQAAATMAFIKYVWFIIPILFSVGLIIYLLMISTKRDNQEYYLR